MFMFFFLRIEVKCLWLAPWGAGIVGSHSSWSSSLYCVTSLLYVILNVLGHGHLSSRATGILL